MTMHKIPIPAEGTAMATREAHTIGVIIGKHLAVAKTGPRPRMDAQDIQRVKNSGRLAIGLIVCLHGEDADKETLSIELGDDVLEAIDKARADLRTMRS